MARVQKKLVEERLAAIEETLRHRPDGLTAREILDALGGTPSLPIRTLQYRLGRLVDSKRLLTRGAGRRTRYQLPSAAAAENITQIDKETGYAGAAGAAAELPSYAAAVGQITGNGSAQAESEITLPLSEAATKIQKSVRQPLGTRTPVGYNRTFLEAYRPNETFYLTPAQRAHLREVGTPKIAEQPAGTYARQILNRLLIDLSWNSSRLEGNTYSLLDTKRLIDLGQEVEGKGHLEAQMILNHKDAIEFLVSSANDIKFNRYTILNLHGMLANNLLPDPGAAGRLRRIGVGIEQSVFHPLEVPQLIEECFDQILATAAAVTDPFEQALFAMVQLPYLQPFDDVNKRVSRLAANIPLIKGNFSPLSFDGISRRMYTDAVLGVYELNRVELLRDVFIWAYERSAARYAAVRQSLGEPDPLRLRYRTQLHEVVSTVVRNHLDKKEASAYVDSWAKQHIVVDDRERFRETAESELVSLHEGNFARYHVTPLEFAAWRTGWTG